MHSHWLPSYGQRSICPLSQYVVGNRSRGFPATRSATHLQDRAALARTGPVAPCANGRLELEKFHSRSTEATPARAGHTWGARHIAFAGEDIDSVVVGHRARGAELVGERNSPQPSALRAVLRAHQKGLLSDGFRRTIHLFSARTPSPDF